MRNFEDIHIKPIIFIKGETKIALFGIGHINDTRLNLAKNTDNLHFERPLNNDGEIDETYFNILVVHQNRFKGIGIGVPRQNSIVDEFYPSFFDLVICGHEHESIPEVKVVGSTGVHILQPGSTVATSLIHAESAQKHCFELKVAKRNYKLRPIPLMNSRPILFKQFELSKYGVHPNKEEKILDLVLNEIKEMIRESAAVIRYAIF